LFSVIKGAIYIYKRSNFICIHQIQCKHQNHYYYYYYYYYYLFLEALFTKRWMSNQYTVWNKYVFKAALNSLMSVMDEIAVGNEFHDVGAE